jgi:Protein phosphatase 2C
MHVRTATEPVPGQENEDAVFEHGGIVGVFDGVTRPDGLDTGCVHTVAWYVTKLAEGLAGAADTQPSGSLADLLAAAISATNAAHADSCDLTNPSTPAATVALMRERPSVLEYLILCDAFIVADDGSTVSVITDPRFENVIRETRATHPIGPGEYGTAEHDARRRAAAMDKQRLTNTEAGYWIAAANPQAAYHAITGQLPLHGDHRVRRVALLTDGAARAVNLFGLITWQEALDLIEKSGPAELIRLVRKAELDDSNGTARPRFKRHDDATVVALSTFEERL